MGRTKPENKSVEQPKKSFSELLVLSSYFRAITLFLIIGLTLFLVSLLSNNTAFIWFGATLFVVACVVFVVVYISIRVDPETNYVGKLEGVDGRKLGQDIAIAHVWCRHDRENQPPPPNLTHLGPSPGMGPGNRWNPPGQK